MLNAVATVGYRDDGLIVQINGRPRSGKADDDHFWSYWHDTAAKWQYSTVGANGYQAEAGSVEGWSYDNGSAEPPAPKQNPKGLYKRLCGDKDPAPRSSAPVAPHTDPTAHPSTAHPTSVHTDGGHQTHAPSTHTATTRTAVSTAAATHTSPAPPPAPHTSRHPAHRASGGPATTSAASSTRTPAGRHTALPVVPIAVPASGRPTSSPSSRAGLRPLPAKADADPSSSGSPVATIVVVAVVVVLLGAGGVVAVRRRHSG